MKIKLVGKPKDAPYLTPGKVYRVQQPQQLIIGYTGKLIDDEGEEIAVLIDAPYACPHARPAEWEVVE